MDLEIGTEFICRLCLQTTDDVVNIWSTFQDSTIADVLSKHFWFQIHKDDDLTKWLCQTCWLQTKWFHEFYKQIELFQKSFLETSQKDISDKGATIDTGHADAEHDLNIIKCEETEITVETVDSHISNHDSSEDDNTADEGETDNISEKEEQSIDKEQKDDSQVMTQKRSSSEKVELEARIREIFNMKCEICSDVEFTTLFKAKQHYRKVHNTQGFITCCGKKYVQRFHVVKHVLNHINPDAYRCDQCNRSFKCETSLKDHINNHVPLDSREFKCSLCPSSFNKGYTLKHHVKNKHTSKTGEKFPCDKCGKNFRSSLLLSCHIRQLHLLAQEYVCEVCARTFKAKTNLLQHIRYEHSSTPPPKVQCDICGAWVKHLKGHRQSHKETKPLNCPICNKVLQTKNSLKNHIAYNHREKRFPCTLCGKEFKCSKNLKEHIAIHTGEDLYNCPYCEKKFKSNGNMYHHRKNVHLAEWKRDRDYPLEANRKGLVQARSVKELKK